jgi:hypothetical protein
MKKIYLKVVGIYSNGVQGVVYIDDINIARNLIQQVGDGFIATPDGIKIQ